MNGRLLDDLFKLGNEDLARIKILLCGFVSGCVAASVRKNVAYSIAAIDLRFHLVVRVDKRLKLAAPVRVKPEKKGAYLIAVEVCAAPEVSREEFHYLWWNALVKAFHDKQLNAPLDISTNLYARQSAQMLRNQRIAL